MVVHKNRIYAHGTKCEYCENRAVIVIKGIPLCREHWARRVKKKDEHIHKRR